MAKRYSDLDNIDLKPSLSDNRIEFLFTEVRGSKVRNPGREKLVRNTMDKYR